MTVQTQAREMREAITCTRDHEEIRSWVDAQNGVPARVVGAGVRDGLRIDFADHTAAGLEHIDWPEWFRLFDATESALIYGLCASMPRKVFAKVVPAPDFGD